MLASHRRPWLPLPAIAFVALCSSAPAAAQPNAEPQSTTYDYSPYEQDTIRIAAEQLHSRVDPNPEGKVVERVEIIPLDVIEPRDPVPGFLNIFHATSRKSVIERELLIHRGDPYKKILVDETARNLRDLPQLSVVLCVPMQGSAPDKIVLAVITKDVWSLRLNWEASYTAGGLESLIVNPSETNLFGMHHSVGGRFELQPESIAYGASYSVRRLTPLKLQTIATASVVFNRSTGAPEGSFGGLSVGRPLITSRSPWSWLAEVSWRNDIYRRYVNARASRFDADATPFLDGIPWEYRNKRALATFSVTESLGWASKHDLTLGAEYSYRRYSLPGLEGYDPAAVSEFRDRKVPRDDIRLDPFVQIRSYTTNFLRVLDFETLGLQEDFRLGHELIARLYPASADFGSSRTWLGTYGAAQYTVALGDGLARVGVESLAEFEQDRIPDAALTSFVRVVTPRFVVGRLVADSGVLNRYRNYLNRTSILGGNGRLRGYPSNYDVGDSLVVSNLEFRSRPVEILSCQIGGALFYDVGDAFDSFSRLNIKQSVGLGFRALFPQLDRYVFRVDVGFPVSATPLPSDVPPASFYVSFGQAFPMPAVEAP